MTTLLAHLLTLHNFKPETVEYAKRKAARYEEGNGPPSVARFLCWCYEMEKPEARWYNRGGEFAERHAEAGALMHAFIGFTRSFDAKRVFLRADLIIAFGETEGGTRLRFAPLGDRFDREDEVIDVTEPVKEVIRLFKEVWSDVDGSP